MSLFNSAFAPRPVQASPFVDLAYPQTFTPQVSPQAALREAKISALRDLDGPAAQLLDEFASSVLTKQGVIEEGGFTASRDAQIRRARAETLMAASGLGNFDTEIIQDIVGNAAVSDDEIMMLEQQLYDNILAQGLLTDNEDERALVEANLFDPVNTRIEEQLHQAALLQMVEDLTIQDPRVPGAFGEDLGQMMLFGPISNASRAQGQGPLGVFFGGTGALQKDAEEFRALPMEEQRRLWPAKLRELIDQATLWGDGKDFLNTENDYFVLPRIDGQGFDTLTRQEYDALEPNDKLRAKRTSGEGNTNVLLLRQNILPYIYGMDDLEKLEMGVWDSVDSLFTVGGYAWGTAKASNHIMKMQRIAGLRKPLEETLRANLNALEQGLPSPTLSTVEEVIDEVTPNAVNPSRTTPDAPSTFNVILENQEEITVRLDQTGLSNMAFEPDQLAEVIAQSINDWQRTLPRRRRVHDVTVRNGTPDAPGIYTPRLTLLVGKADNTSYVSPASGAAAAKRMGYDPDTIKVVHKSADEPQVGAATVADDAFDVLPVARDEVYLSMVKAFDEDPDGVAGAFDGIILFNPTEEQAKAAVSRAGPLKVISTKEGNVVMAPGIATTHADMVEELGVNIRNVGRGFYDGKDAVGGAKYSFKDSLKAIDRFNGPDDADAFRLRRVNPTPAEDATRAKLVAERDAADQELAAANRQMAVVENDRAFYAKPENRYLRAGAKEPLGPKRYDQAKKDVVVAQKKLDEAQAKLDDYKSDSPTLVQKNDGGYYLEIDIPLNARGTWRPFDETRWHVFGLGRALLSGRGISEEMMGNFATLSDITRGAIINFVRKEITPRLKKINRRERQTMANAADQMRNGREWWSDTKMRDFFIEAGHDIRRWDRFREAYVGYRMASDTIDWGIRNGEIYHHWALRGFQTIRIDTEAFPGAETGYVFDWRTGKVHTDLPSNLSSGRILDATTGTIVDNYSPSQLQAKGRVLVELADVADTRLATGESVSVRYVVADRGQVTRRRLDPEQLNYVAGGSHVEYDGAVRKFAKQAVRRTQEDTGQTQLLTPKTWVGGTRESDLTEYVDLLNQARRAILRFTDPRGTIKTHDGLRRTLNQILRDGPEGLPTADELLEWWNNHTYRREGVRTFDPTEPIEIVNDRELPSAYQGVDDLPFDAEAPTARLMEHQRGMYYSGRGNRLTDAHGEELPILDPFTALDRGISQAVKLGATTAYKTRAANRWLTSFGDIINNPVSAQTDAEILVRQLWDQASTQWWGRESIFRQGTPEVQKQKALSELAALSRTLNWKTEGQKRIRSIQIGIADMMDSLATNRLTGNPFTRAASDLTHWSMSREFGYGLRQMAFDAKLGLFNWAQIPLQITTALAISVTDPIAAGQSLATYPILRLYADHRFFRPGQLRNFMRQHADTLGMSNAQIDEFVEMAEELKMGGYLNVTGQQLQGDETLGSLTDIGRLGSQDRTVLRQPREALSFTKKYAGRARDAGRGFFNNAEIINRMFAFNAAWRNTRKRFPDLEVGSQAFRERLYGNANDLAFNMTQNARAAWQSGGLGYVTQFFPYGARWVELMTPAGTSLTAQQRSLLLFSQPLLLGTTGTAFVRGWNDQRKQEDFGSSPTFEPSDDLGERFGEVIKHLSRGLGADNAVLDRGLLDTMGFLAFNQDGRFTDRASILPFFFDQWERLWGNSQYGEVTPIDLLGGASVGIAIDIWGDLGDLWAAKMQDKVMDPMSFQAETEGDSFVPYSQKELVDVLRNVATINNIVKASDIIRHGTLRGSEGDIVAKDLDFVDAVYTALTIPLQEQDVLTAKMGYIKDRAETIDDHLKVINWYNTEISLAQSPERALQLRRGKALYYGYVVDPALRSDLFNRDGQYPITSMLENVMRTTTRLEATEIQTEAINAAIAEDEGTE